MNVPGYLVFKTALSPVLHWHPPKFIIHAYIIVSVAVYVFLAVHTPMTVYANAPHDDGLYMKLGEYLSEGKWLGPFDQYTLMKGPGYPLFIALSNWLGTPLSLFQGLFVAGAAAFFVVIAHRFLQSVFLSGLLLALLLWHPLNFSPIFQRVLRDDIYSSQVLVFVAALAVVLFSQRGRQAWLYGAIAGLDLGWLWLTREEGVWLVPGIFFLTAAAALHAHRARAYRDLAVPILLVVATFAAVLVGFDAVNWRVYGKFVGVDVKETYFEKALGALDSVRSGGTIPFVSVTAAARQQIYEISPSFASLSKYIDSLPGTAWTGWTGLSCGAQPATCGEIGSGWFIWALRDAAAQAGHYESPRNASAFFRDLANEVSSACASGALTCSSQLIPDMPPWTWQQLFSGLFEHYSAAMYTIVVDHPSVAIGDSYGDEDSLEARLKFLNNPLHTPSPDVPPPLNLYQVSGWYYNSGADWISVVVRKPDGSSADSKIKRGASPDIASGVKDPVAMNQRFLIYTHCDDDCILQIQGADGTNLEKKLGDLVKMSVTVLPIGTGHLAIESTLMQTYLVQGATPAERLAVKLREAGVDFSKFLIVPAVVVGLCALAGATLFFPRRCVWNVSYVLALGCGLLVFSRISLLIIIVQTSFFSALQVNYIAPAGFLLACCAVFACAAWVQVYEAAQSRIETHYGAARGGRERVEREPPGHSH